jgi:hypothetical protein
MIWDPGFSIEGQHLLSDSSPYQKENCLFLYWSHWKVFLLIRLGNVLYIRCVPSNVSISRTPRGQSIVGICEQG